MAINPLPPGTRKPTSVGLPYGTEIVTWDESGPGVASRGNRGNRDPRRERHGRIRRSRRDTFWSIAGRLARDRRSGASGTKRRGPFPREMFANGLRRTRKKRPTPWPQKMIKAG